MQHEAPARLCVLRTSEMSQALLARTRQLLLDVFGEDLSDDDWRHALGGWHVLVQREGLLLSHAAVVARELHLGGLAVRAGYVEGVATDAALQGRGLGTLAMRGADAVLRREFDLGALSTGEHGFYERLGWERWRGPSYVRLAGGPVRTPTEDDGIMVLRYGSTASVDLSLPISCEPRSGDDW